MSSASPHDRQRKIAEAAGASGGNRKAILGAIIGLLVVVGIVLALWLPNRGGDTTAQPSGTTGGSGTAQPTSGGAVKLPKGVKDPNSPVVASNGGVLRDGVPTLAIFEDFQCPNCKVAEDAFGGRIGDLAKAGKINVVYYLKTFMNDNLRNDSSTKVGNAALCAADAGKFEEYHDKVFAKQPANEGPGYSDEAVQTAATEAGISGAALDTWKQCVSAQSYLPYLKGLEKFTSEPPMNVRATPAFYVNNKQISLSGIRTADDFEKKLFETAK